MHITDHHRVSSNQIWVTFQREGTHAYPAALTDPKLEQVKFLGYPHRHIFHFRVAVDVQHNDRDIEFIIFKRYLESLYVDGITTYYKSVEMMADDLAEILSVKYPNRNFEISVSEDNENGCIKKYEAFK